MPEHQKDDNVLPSISEIPAFMEAMRHPRRRAVSIGPQSEADAYETLAYREKRRRNSKSSGALSPSSAANNRVDGHHGYFTGKSSSPNGATTHDATSRPSKLEIYEGMMGTGFDQSTAVISPAISDNHDIANSPTEEVIAQLEEKEMFSKLEKPRVRYDVEVVTKLIVYSGIAWLAVEGNPLVFEAVGLGI